MLLLPLGAREALAYTSGGSPAASTRLGLSVEGTCLGSGPRVLLEVQVGKVFLEPERDPRGRRWQWPLDVQSARRAGVRLGGLGVEM